MLSVSEAGKNKLCLSYTQKEEYYSVPPVVELGDK
jgi:hypothetical protein